MTRNQKSLGTMKSPTRNLRRAAAVIGSTIVLWLSTATLLAPSLQITSPADGSIVHPGQTITVTATDSPSGSFQQVTIIGQSPIGFGAPVTAPPYHPWRRITLWPLLRRSAP